ncbi:MAG: hypothetical protein JO288_00825 [Hyphomicrobiales bacterium]|nr:hypothetical protein [Hyphomicrobiales bacterium]
MSPYDLTNLAALKAWLGLPSGAGPNDATLSALITAASRTIYAALSRPGLLPQAYVETIDLETRRVYLRHWPVLKVASVVLRGITIPPDSNPDLEASFGYALQPGEAAPPGLPQAIDLFGECLRRARQSLVVSYTAGYAVQGEAQTISSSAPLQLSALAPYGPWAGDLGIVYAGSGAALTPVAIAPSAGQYVVSSGSYLFSAADAGQAIALSYSYVPQDVAQAALELAAERFRAAERIGLRSKSAGGQETIAYDVSAVSAPVLAMLQPYKRVAV